MAKLALEDVAKLLVEYGRRAALAGDNPYRSRAYLRAAESLGAQTEPLARLVEEDRLREIPGVGDAIADIITKLYETGTHPSLEKMRRKVPEGVLDMLSIPGLRPEKVLKLHEKLGVATLGDLEAAAKQDRIKDVKGLGAALQRKILQGLAMRRETQGARHVHRAEELITAAQESLKRADPSLNKIVPAGDFRRGNELVTDLALVAQAARLEGGPRQLKTGELSVTLTDAKRFGISLLLATGSEKHVDELRKLAKQKGYKLTPDGLQRAGKIIASKTESELYEALGLQYIEPELREGRGEIALARAGQLPRLVTQKDIRGILHAHTVESDGGNTLDEMAEAARARGYHYFGVSDHSQTAHYAGGLSIQEIEQQHDEIDRLNAGYGGKFHIFKGIESDILPDGSLDYPDDILGRFDFIVASVHGQFRMERAAQTARILSAVRNPFVTVLGHMTGRQLLRRPGYEVDVEKILAACAIHGVAIEINANPWRLDLDWRWYQRGLELGCMFSINPDAHFTSEIDLVRWGVSIARKGGIPPGRVVNCLGLKAFTKWLDARRAARAKMRIRSAASRKTGSR